MDFYLPVPIKCWPDGNPYSHIEKIIRRWAEANFYDDFLVTCSVRGELDTEILKLCSDLDSFEWRSDWLDGEFDISLVGFAPVSSIKVFGVPELEDEEEEGHAESKETL